MADSSGKKKRSGGAKVLGYALITVGVFVLLSGGWAFLTLGGLSVPVFAWLSLGAICLVFGALALMGGSNNSSPKQGD